MREMGDEEQDYASSEDEDFDPEKEEEKKREPRKKQSACGARTSGKVDVFGEPVNGNGSNDKATTGTATKGSPPPAEEDLPSTEDPARKSKIDALWTQLNSGNDAASKKYLAGLHTGKPAKWGSVVGKGSVASKTPSQAGGRKIDSTWAALMSGKAPPKAKANAVLGSGTSKASGSSKGTDKSQTMSAAARLALKAAAAVVKGDVIGSGEGIGATQKVKIVEEKDFAGEMIK